VVGWVHWVVVVAWVPLEVGACQTLTALPQVAASLDLGQVECLGLGLSLVLLVLEGAWVGV
jgi:hypothetical protein